MHKLNDYNILLSKLLDLFIESQKEKIFQLQYLNKLKSNSKEISKENKDISNLEPIVFDFIFSCLIYQQCFYQGIPVTIIRKPFISYCQLPHITINNFEKFKEKNVNITLEQFLKYADNEKLDIIKNVFDFKNSEINDIIEASKVMPRYDYKVKTYVEGFENTGFIKGDKVTFKIDITRKNKEDKKLGILHSKCFPGIFNEVLYALVFNGKNLIKMDKILIDKKENEYKLTILINAIGIIPIKIFFISGNFLLNNDIINCQIKSEERNEKRDEMMKNIENITKGEKIAKNFFQKMLLDLCGSDDYDEIDEENEDDEANNNEEEKEDNKI